MIRTRIPRQLAILLFIGTAAAVLPPRLGAQQSDSIHHRNNCRFAGQVLTLGQPASYKSWALRYVPSCEAIAVEIFAEAVRRNRGAHTGSSELGAIVDALSSLVDRRIGLAAARLARDGSAGPGARVEAIRLLYSQIRPGYPVPFEEFIARPEVVYDSETATSTRVRLLSGEWVIDAPHFVGEPYSADEWEALAVELELIARDSSAPADVRIAGERVHTAYNAFLRGQRLCPPGTGPVECARRLRDERP